MLVYFLCLPTTRQKIWSNAINLVQFGPRSIQRPRRDDSDFGPRKWPNSAARARVASGEKDLRRRTPNRTQHLCFHFQSAIWNNFSRYSLLFYRQGKKCFLVNGPGMGYFPTSGFAMGTNGSVEAKFVPESQENGSRVGA